MYESQERFDLQFGTKSLASDLKSATKLAWADLGRLVGYMKFSESCALRMSKQARVAAFRVSCLEVKRKRKRIIETYSDSH